MAEFPEQFDPENLPASLEDLGSAIDGDPVRETRFNRLLIEAAEFTTEEPNYAHRAVALLVLLGLSTVVSANWDDCVERAAVELRGKITPTVTEDDRRKLKWHQGFHKVHGCANYEDSLLVSKEALKEPPDWVAKAVGADIGAETLVFVGLATVGDYVRTRIEQLLEVARDVIDVQVVVPDETLPEAWGELLGEGAEKNHIRATAVQFLDELLRAVWCHALGKVRIELGKLCGDKPPASVEKFETQFDQLVSALEHAEHVDALRLLRWWTDGVDPTRKTQILTSSDARMQLLAVASLVQAPPDVHAADDGVVVFLDDCYVEVACADGGSGSDLLRRQDARIAKRASRGAYPRRDRPVLVLHEGAGTAVPTRARDVASGTFTYAGDLVEGAEGPKVIYRGWMEILRGNVPREDLLAA
jgi:hypothetical protein